MPSIGEGGTAADGASNTGNAIKTTPGIIRDGGSMAGSSTSTDNARTGSGCQKQDETLEEKLERARRIAAERVEAEKAKAKAKAKAFVGGVYPAAVAKAADAVTGSSPSSNSSSNGTSSRVLPSPRPRGQALAGMTAAVRVWIPRGPALAASRTS